MEKEKIERWSFKKVNELLKKRTNGRVQVTKGYGLFHCKDSYAKTPAEAARNAGFVI